MDEISPSKFAAPLASRTSDSDGNVFSPGAEGITGKDPHSQGQDYIFVLCLSVSSLVGMAFQSLAGNLSTETNIYRHEHSAKSFY